MIEPAVAYSDEDMARAWEEGAIWAAIECDAIAHPRQRFLVPEDNPYRT